jgi:hypothetical protein
MPIKGPERGGSGPMIVILIAASLMCVGSIGGGVYFVWRAQRLAAERELDAAQDARFAAEEQERAAARERFERVARAVAKRLKSPDRLRDSYTLDGKPLLSWRVHLLPDLGEAELYKQFKQDEAWDGPTNRNLLEQIPDVYDYDGPRLEWLIGLTFIRGCSQTGGVFEPRAEFALKDLTPGPDSTLAIYDSGDPVEWTRPDQFEWLGDGTLNTRGSFLAAMASGRVVWIDRRIQANVLWSICRRRHDPKWDQMAREWME